MVDQPHLSPQAYERLQAELTERTTTRKLELSLAIERAREHGDIKENADYDAAKNEQGINAARIRQLEQMLKDAVVIDGNTAGDLVEAIEERNEKYTVLSTNSPIGMAIVGKGPGETVTYQGPKREMSVTIVAVRLPD